MAKEKPTGKKVAVVKMTPAAKDPDAAKQANIKKIMDDAAKKLEGLGVKYFIGVVDKDTKRSDGGKAYAQSDVTGEDFTHILDMALPTRQDVINLGIWVGQLIHARAKQPLS